MEKSRAIAVNTKGTKEGKVCFEQLAFRIFPRECICFQLREIVDFGFYPTLMSMLFLRCGLAEHHGDAPFTPPFASFVTFVFTPEFPGSNTGRLAIEKSRANTGSFDSGVCTPRTKTVFLGTPHLPPEPRAGPHLRWGRTFWDIYEPVKARGHLMNYGKSRRRRAVWLSSYQTKRRSC